MEVKILHNGKEIGRTDSGYVEVEHIEDYIRNGLGSKLLTFTKSKTVYVNWKNIKLRDSNVELDYNFFNRRYDFVVKALQIPKGIKLPKKKRLRNKVKKKHTYTYIYKECQIRY